MARMPHCERFILEEGRRRPHGSPTTFEFVSSESSSEDVPLCYYAYMTPFLDHKDKEGIILNPRMRVERDEVPWTELRFE